MKITHHFIYYFSFRIVYPIYKIYQFKVSQRLEVPVLNDKSICILFLFPLIPESLRCFQMQALFKAPERYFRTKINMLPTELPNFVVFLE